jgi:hypothetical protein
VSASSLFCHTHQLASLLGPTVIRFYDVI